MRALVRLSIVLAFVVVVLGAYTRLTDAGLGCPDWPGCYGHLTVPAEHQVEAAQAKYPNQLIEPEKAWNEMIHRYFAGSLGLLILIITLAAFIKPYSASIKKYSSGLLALVCFQAILGMWTVTLVLMPVIVMAHLLGGFSIFVLLVLLERKLSHAQADNKTYSKIEKGRVPKFGWLCLAVLLFQIALGGWTSSNYAALACTQLPVCEPGWQERLDLNAFHLISPQADTYLYGVLDYSARMTIHIGHRFWAVVTVFMLILWSLFSFQILKKQAQNTKLPVKNIYLFNISLLLLLAAQFSLGVANIVLSLPILVAVMHNAVALLLLSVMSVSLYYFSAFPFYKHASQQALNFRLNESTKRA
ncbi:COX15/CtaA family protein [Catenovulum sp. 2E275]|nr:COX15/CtaA family protein [Catenovulum sp. 2E275]